MKIKSIKKNKLEEKKSFYDITVDVYHNFVIGDSKILTHNSSLNGAIIGMAQDFKNSMALLDGIGQFGSLRSPEPGAPRYISTKLNSNFRLLYKDFDLLESQWDEGVEIEPKFFLPIIPAVLLNGSSGIAVGFATNILNRNPLDLIDACLKTLDNKKFAEPLPWWKYYNGEVVKLDKDSSSFQIKGRYEIINTTTIRITELPPSMTYQKYELHLNSLQDKGIIQYYDDNCKKDINYTVKFSRKELATRLEKGQLEGLLKLVENETENLTCLDENGNLIVFSSVTDLIKHFTCFRLGFYEKRKRKQVEDLTRQILILNNRSRFIKSIIDGKLKPNNRPKVDIISDLTKAKFDTIDSSFDYLLNMSIYSLTKEKYEDLLTQIEKNVLEIKKIESIAPIDLYKEDLQNLKKSIKISKI